MGQWKVSLKVGDDKIFKTLSFLWNEADTEDGPQLNFI
jgi:hypothetical protein